MGTHCRPLLMQGHSTLNTAVSTRSDVHAQGGVYGNAQQAAAGAPSLDILRRLIQLGVDVNAQGGQFGNALSATACRGSLDIARLLITGLMSMRREGMHFMLLP